MHGFGNGCVAIPSFVVNCILGWLAFTAFMGLVFPGFCAGIMSTFAPLDNDWEESIKSWKYMARFGAILAIIGIVCYFVFMAPDAKSIAEGTSTCSYIINGAR
jgi:hypothetical protein